MPGRRAVGAGPRRRRKAMTDLDSNGSTQTDASEKGDEQTSFHITPEIAKRWRKENREWKRQEKLRERYAKSTSYWILDETPDDYPGRWDDTATTRAQRKRVRVRSWISWPNLGRLVEKQIFGVGLGAVMLVPAANGFLNIIESLIEKAFPNFSRLGLPLQAKVLFFSGLCFVIGNAIYFFRCPAIVKAATSDTADSPRPPMFNKMVITEAAFFFSHLVVKTFITKETLRLVDARIYAHQHAENPQSLNITKLRKDERETCEYLLNQGITPLRTGFSGIGMYYVEKFLLASAESRGGRLFIRRRLECPWETAQEASLMLADELSLFHGLLHHPESMLKKAEGSTKKDIFLEWYLADARQIPELEERGSLLKYLDPLLYEFHVTYFEGCDFDKMANLLAEWQYYERPWSRVAVAVSFIAAVGLLGLFLVLQTVAVLDLL
jgi:hypothetical protein